MKLGDIEKLAVEVAELANREAALNAESARVLEELSAVRAAKSQKLQRLASGGNGSGTPASAVAPVAGATDAKERVYRMVIADPSHVVTIQDVHKSLGMNRNTASVYLSELAKADRIARLAKGKYQAIRGEFFKFGHVEPVENDSAIPARILALLASEPESTFTAPLIAKRFGVSGESNVNTIRGALSRLSRDGKIAKVGRGDYRAVSADGTR